MKLQVFALLLCSALFAGAQDAGPKLTPRTADKTAAETPKANSPADSPATSTRDAHTVTIAAGTTLPVRLSTAISTKSARAGDKVYAETTFPLVRNEQVLIPPGTYVQGVISKVERPGRVKGRAQLLVHFTTLIFPTGYTVMLPGAVEQLHGAEHQQVKGEEGTLEQEGEKGKDAGTIATTAGTGALIGGAVGGGKGLGLGAATGGAAGLAIALLSRGSDLRLDAGSTLEMVFQRDISIDGDRIAKR